MDSWTVASVRLMHQEERLAAEPEPQEGPSGTTERAVPAGASGPISAAGAPPLTPGLLRYLQRTAGNTAVAGLVSRSGVARLQRLPAKGPNPMQASGLSSKVQQEIDERKRADEGAKD